MSAPCYFHQMASYEAAKREWAYSHPDATAAQYEAAMERLARECGV